ncbi:LAMI_0E02344g1_1 [Lachancea mirantina]|uniref:LAMI_0E02344g1_1 n=1 Tax=Lachancea mirantina TaxID=1230905 RepID=A0A1G4JJK4_9SACH|nr:LAMI_0E02344g1_1 [Lachancea mirantina]
MSENEYSEDQEKITLSILGHEKSAFYELLHVEKKASDNEIKKAYRKLAIKLHPDKNKHPRASEAFKRINRAFEVLSDEQKRRMFDQLGYDPDDRSAARDPFSSGAASSSSGFRSSGFGPQGMFYRQAAGRPPQDIFDFLFNAHAAGGGHPFNGGPFGGPFGGAFGSPFDGPFGGGGTTFTFGGPNGFKVYTNGQGARRPAAGASTQTDEQAENREIHQIIRILVPLLFILFLPMLERLLFGS